ncbi:MAG: hypothetical protein HYV07_16365 [Deltaproteobacteria bacterium]|nr:hypothetical protein [Deltaproteobacteria bacterium]
MPRILWGLVAAIAIAIGAFHAPLSRGLTTALGALDLVPYGVLEENEAGTECRRALIAGELGSAQRACERALAIDGTHTCRRELAEVFLRRGQLETALLEIDRNLKVHPLDGVSAILRAQIQKALKRPNEEIVAGLSTVRDRLVVRRKEIDTLASTEHERAREKHSRRKQRLDLELESLAEEIEALSR